MALIPKISINEDPCSLWLSFPKAYMVFTVRSLTANERFRYAYGFSIKNTYNAFNNYISGHCVKNGELMINPGHPPTDSVLIKKLKKAYEF